MPPKISIIIPAHNSEATLEECLQALCNNDYAKREIILVDDVSTDHTIEIAKRFHTEIIRLDRNSGPAAARNRGALAATGEMLFFIDSDVKIPENALSLIAEIFRDRSVEAITGLFCDTQRYSNFSSQYKNLWMHHTYKRLRERASVFYTSGAAIRRDVFLSSGSFDENYDKPSIEDTEYSDRLRDNGHDVYVRKDLTVEHIKKYTFRSMLRTDFMRSSALTRMFIRRGLIWKNRTNSSSVPTSFISSVFLLFVSVSLLLIGSILGRHEILIASIITYIIFITSNCAFLKTLWQKRGFVFVLRSIAAITIDTLVAGLGVIAGCVGYMIGERY